MSSNDVNKTKGNYYPENWDETVGRVKELVVERRSGKLSDLAEKMGLSGEWVEKRHQDDFRFGPAEQANPFLTVYAHAREHSASPESLAMELAAEERAAVELLSSDIRTQLSLITLKYDQVTANGPTALYEFSLPTESYEKKQNGNSQKVLVPRNLAFLPRKTIESNFEETPFSSLQFPRDTVRNFINQTQEYARPKEKGALIVDEKSGKKTQIQGKPWGYLRKFAFDNKISGEDLDQAVALFKGDLEKVLQTMPDGNSLNYFDFVTRFNELTVNRFTEQLEYSTYPLDQEFLADFPINGVRDWKKFLNCLAENKMLDLENDPLFRLTVTSSGGRQKFVRLAFKDGGSVKEGKLVDEDPILVNVDYTGSGETQYRLSDLLSESRKALVKGEPNLFFTKNVEYFLLVSGLGNTMMGDDGVHSDSLHKQVDGMRNLGFRLPMIFCYAPHNQGLDGYTEAGSKPVFNETASLMHFYLYMKGLEQLKERSRNRISSTLELNSDTEVAAVAESA